MRQIECVGYDIHRPGRRG